MITNNNRKIYSQPELSGAWYHLNHKTMVPDKLKSGRGGRGSSLANQTGAWKQAEEQGGDKQGTGAPEITKGGVQCKDPLLGRFYENENSRGGC